MKLTYYGTAAAEAWPGVFCQCQYCQEARKRKGKDIRTRSQALVNDDLLLDLCPDTLLHCLNYGLDLEKVQALLITHSHTDHCYIPELGYLKDPFSRTRQGQLQVFGNEAVERKVIQDLHTLGGEHVHFDFHRILPNLSFNLRSYRVTPLRATHAPGEIALYYHIAQGEKSLLYAHDTGTLTEENLDTIARQPGKLSLVSLDCTTQQNPSGSNHMNLYDAAEQKEKLLARGLADENTVWVVNHFSHNGGWLHDELCVEAGKLGFRASYDGMSIEF